MTMSISKIAADFDIFGGSKPEDKDWVQAGGAKIRTGDPGFTYVKGMKSKSVLEQAKPDPMDQIMNMLMMKHFMSGGDGGQQRIDPAMFMMLPGLRKAGSLMHELTHHLTEMMHGAGGASSAGSPAVTPEFLEILTRSGIHPDSALYKRIASGEQTLPDISKADVLKIIRDDKEFWNQPIPLRSAKPSSGLAHVGTAIGGGLVASVLLRALLRPRKQAKNQAVPTTPAEIKKQAIDSMKTLADLTGGGVDPYTQRIIKGLTPEHWAAAGHGTNEDRMNKLLDEIIPQHVLSEHASRVGGGNVDLGKLILDTYLRENPSKSGLGLKSELKNRLGAHLSGIHNAEAAQVLSGFGPMMGKGQKERQPLKQDDFMKMIAEFQQATPAAAPAPAADPSADEPKYASAWDGLTVDDLKEYMAFKKTAIIEFLPHILGAAGVAGLGLGAQHLYNKARSGAPSSAHVSQNLPVNRFVDEKGRPFQFDPETFQSTLTADPSVGRMARGMGSGAHQQLGAAMNAGLGGGVQRLLAKMRGHGKDLNAAQQALQNLAQATGGLSTDRTHMAEHFRNMTGLEGSQLGQHLSRILMAAKAPASGEFSQTAGNRSGLGGMNIDSPNFMNQMMMMQALRG